MTTPADDRAAEEAFEACLAGRPVPAGAPGLAAFTDAVRAGATAPGRPNAALAELLVIGLLPDASTRTVGPARSSRKRPRMILSTLVTKFVAAGAVAKAATAGGAVALALTGAVSTDVLPLPGEDTAVVEAGEATDDTATDGGSDTGDGGTDGGTTGDGSTDDGTDGDGTDGDGTDGDGTDGDGTDGDGTDGDGTDGDGTDGDGTDGDGTDGTVEDQPVDPAVWVLGPDGDQWQSFGAWVSAGSHAGLVRGDVVSCFARADKPGRPTTEDCQALAADSLPAPDQEEPVAQPPAAPVDDTDQGVVDEAPVQPAPAPTATGGNGNGSGNAGHGSVNGGNAGGNGNPGDGGNPNTGNGNSGNGGGNGNAGNGGGNGNGNRGR